MSDPIRFRYTNETVGALVLLAVVLFIVALLQSGRLREWFEPKATLKVLMPGEGLFGLSKGAKVDILGTQAGVVDEIVIVPGQRIHARVILKERMKAFVRNDSRAVIRKEFGVAVLSSQLAAQAGRLPELSSDTADILGSLQLILQDLSRTTPELPKLIESVNAASGDLPILLMQTRQTLAELTVLLQQLQSHWLLGGSRPTPVPGDRISPLEVRP
jgi:ABC-type transporter Mla subunit MlaD